MAVIAEGALVVTAIAGRTLALDVEAVSVSIVQVVNLAIKVVAPMTVGAEALLAVTSGAIVGVSGRPVAMLVSPAFGMNVSQRDWRDMTQITIVVHLLTIVAGHTCRHDRQVVIVREGASRNVRVTRVTGHVATNMILVAEQYGRIYVRDCHGIIRIRMALAAGVIVIDIMTITADNHLRVIAIGCGRTGFNVGVAGGALYLLLDDMQRVREDQRLGTFVCIGFGLPRAQPEREW
jgi:hypothetical protein